MKKPRIRVICTASLVLLSASVFVSEADAAANQQAQTPVAEHTATPTSISQQYGLVDVHYTSSQIGEIKNIAKAQSVKTPFVPTKMGGPSGVYRLLSATGRNNVVELNFNDMAVLSANYFDDLTNWFKAPDQKSSLVAQQKVKLGNGIEARWWQVKYTDGAMAQFLALTQGNTWISLQPNPAHPLESFEQGVANCLVPLTDIKPSSSSSAPKPSIPAWFIHDIQITKQASPTVGENYILNYGDTNVYTGIPQMNQVWYGALSNYGKNHVFGYSWAGVYQLVTSDGIPPLLSINVLEQTKQDGTTIGLLVPAKCTGIGNGDFVAFANGEAIIATNKSGEVYYSVYPVKGVSVPSSNLGVGSPSTHSGHNTAASLATVKYTHTQVTTIQKEAELNGVSEPYMPTKSLKGDVFQTAGGTNTSPNSIPKGGMLSVIFKRMVINESNAPITGGGVVIDRYNTTLPNNTPAQWVEVQAKVGAPQWVLSFKKQNTYINMDTKGTNAATVQVAESLVSLQSDE